MLKCEKIMDKVFEYVSVRDNIEKVLKIISSEHLDSIPVVEDLLTKKFVGQITDRDILLEVFLKGKEPVNTLVESVMVKNSTICGSETSVNDALLLMLRDGCLRLPVVDEKNTLVGVISADHLCETHQLKFTWDRLLDTADESLFESNFERNREAYEKRIDMELANSLSFLDILELKSRIEISDESSKDLYNAIFNQLEFLRKELETAHKSMKLSKDKNWYLLRDEFEVARLKLNKRLFEFKKPISDLLETKYNSRPPSRVS